MLKSLIQFLPYLLSNKLKCLAFSKFGNAQTNLAQKKAKTTTSLFTFTTPENADFRIQRVGGNAGKASFDLSKSTNSNYFVKNTSDLTNEELVEIINNTIFDSIENTVGPKSLSKGELIEILEENLT